MTSTVIKVESFDNANKDYYDNSVWVMELVRNSAMLFRASGARGYVPGANNYFPIFYYFYLNLIAF